MKDSLQDLQEQARIGCFFTVDIPCYNVELADKICSAISSKVRKDTVLRLQSLLSELSIKDEKLRELGINPDLL